MSLSKGEVKRKVDIEDKENLRAWRKKKFLTAYPGYFTKIMGTSEAILAFLHDLFFSVTIRLGNAGQ